MALNFKDIHLKNYFTSDYLFQVDRISLHLSDWVFLGIGVGLVAVAILAKLIGLYVKHPVAKKPFNRVFKVFLSTGLVECVWFAFRYENGNVIGTHIVAILVLVVGLLYFYPILKYCFRSYRKERQEWDKEQLKLKYLKA